MKKPSKISQYLEKLYNNRFYIWTTLILLDLCIPDFTKGAIGRRLVLVAFQFLLVVAGMNIIQKSHKVIIAMMTLGAAGFVLQLGEDTLGEAALFYAVFILGVAYSLYRQILIAKEMSLHLIIGVFSGYLMLGFISYYAFLALEVFVPNSFSGLSDEIGIKRDQLVYFSFITLLTVGYGDISPLTPDAQRLSIGTAIIGQFYTTVVMALLVGQFLGKKAKDNKEEG